MKNIIDHDYPGDELDDELVIYSSLLHDVCDHKYPESIKFEAL